VSDVLQEPEMGVAGEGGDQRIATLQQLTARLARLGSSSEVASYVLGEGIAKLGATNGSLCLAVGNHLELTAWIGYSEEVVSAWRYMPLDADTPAGQCMLSRRAIYCESIEDLLERWPVFRSQPITGDPSFAVLPLETSDGRTLGVMVLGYAEPKRFDAADRRFLEALAPEAAAALDRARANEALVAARAAAESASVQLAFLAEASARLAASLDLRETLETVAELAVPRIADRCVLYLAEESGEISKHPLAPLTPEETAVLVWRSLKLDDAGAVSQVISNGRSLYSNLVSDDAIARAASSQDHLELLRRVGFGGVFIVALHARGQAFGALAFANRRGRPLPAEERALAEELAARAAVAIDNSRLFGRELRIAETLQQALLPERLPDVPGVSLAATYQAGTLGIDVGGDWYDVIPLAPDRLLVVVGDVSGRGLRAARVMASLRHGIRAYALEGHDPSSILGRLGKLLDIARDEHFATVLCGLVDVAAREVTLASAGHLDPLLIGRAHAARLASAVGPPIGVDCCVTYRAVTTPLEPGSTLLAFTDGLIERRGEHLDDGIARLATAALGRAAHDLPGLLAGVLAELAPAGPEDDTAILALRLER
jgi:serine phosphatase RsbU (regulator of sigma subunit)